MQVFKDFLYVSFFKYGVTYMVYVTEAVRGGGGGFIEQQKKNVLVTVVWLV